jgi:hypothetical protein
MRVRRLHRLRRRPRLLALIPFRDEMRFLPGFFQNVAPHVDGVVALDDQSSDESAAFADRQRCVLELLHNPPGSQADQDDALLHRKLIEAAWEHDADWLLGIDADERLEDDFRQRAEEAMRRADLDGHRAYWVHFLELWEPARYRVDGIWGTKRKACLFRSADDHQFDSRRLHRHWASLPDPDERWPAADLRIYHLRMIDPADRLARVERYRRLDPDLVLQPRGYDYLLDEEGLELRDIEPGRGYTPLWPPAAIGRLPALARTGG